MSETTLVFIDLETTGTRSTRDRITEIAAIKVVEGRVADCWSSLINPQCTLPPHIHQLTGIGNDALKDAPAFKTIAEELHAWLGKACIVAHNARFDYSFLRNEFKRAGIDYRTAIICTLRLSRRLAPGEPQHSLQALLEKYEITVARHHRASDDVAALWQLWQSWQYHYPDVHWQAALASEQRYQSLPALLCSRQLENLPSLPGVYLFYGHNRLPLYIGKSINLRSRVLGHFQRDYQDDKEMRLVQQIQHIEWEETAGDLGAQLREAQLIKQLMPVMNRRLRRQGKLQTWLWHSEEHSPTLVNGHVLGKSTLGKRYGLFRSAKEAKETLRAIAEQHRLCPQILGLDKGRGRCFAYQLNKCHGACCGKETLAAHTHRAHEAMLKLQVDTWPWPGRLVICEQGITPKSTTYHTIDQWCYLGSAKTLQEAKKISTKSPSFDTDTYRILHRFLNQAKRHHLTLMPL